MAAAWVAESSRLAPPGCRSASNTCRRLKMRVRSATRSSRRSDNNRKTTVSSSTATGRSRRWWIAAAATEQASAASVLRALLVPSSRARAASLAGTSRTCSPAATSSWAIPRPRPLAPSTAQHRSGQTAAQASSCRAAWAGVGTRSWPSSLLLESSAAAVNERLWGSIQMVITGGLSSRRDGVRDGQPDFRWAHASVEPRHGGCRPHPGTLSASQPHRAARSLRARRPAPWTLRAADLCVLATFNKSGAGLHPSGGVAHPDSHQAIAPPLHVHQRDHPVLGCWGTAAGRLVGQEIAQPVQHVLVPDPLDRLHHMGVAADEQVDVRRGQQGPGQRPLPGGGGDLVLYAPVQTDGKKLRTGPLGGVGVGQDAP